MKPKSPICKSCQLGKHARNSFKVKEKLSSSKPLQLVHMDLCGPSRIEAPGREKYFMMVYNYSSLIWVALLRNKS